MSKGTWRPNVLPARVGRNMKIILTQAKQTKTTTDLCDKCLCIIPVYKKLLYQRVFNKKIYCRNCFFSTPIKDRKNIIRGGVNAGAIDTMLLRKSQKEKNNEPIYIKEVNKICPYGVVINKYKKDE